MLIYRRQIIGLKQQIKTKIAGVTRLENKEKYI